MNSTSPPRPGVGPARPGVGPAPCGVGIGLRREHYESILQTQRRIDWLEIIPENYVDTGGVPRAKLRACLERWQVVAHGVSLSLAGRGPFDDAYISGLKDLLDELEAPYYSDHLCYSSLDGVAYHDLLPVPFNDDAVRHCASRIRELADRLARPIAVENISFYAVMPGSTMSHGEFVTAVVEEADCKLLLDCNNVFVNATNHALPSEAVDATAWLDGLPLHRAVQMHIAGHVEEDGRLLDNHGAPLVDGVWQVYREALRRTGPIPVLLEWDTDIPELDRVLDEADAARAVYDEVCGALPPTQPPKERPHA